MATAPNTPAKKRKLGDDAVKLFEADMKDEEVPTPPPTTFRFSTLVTVKLPQPVVRYLKERT